MKQIIDLRRSSAAGRLAIMEWAAAAGRAVVSVAVLAAAAFASGEAMAQAKTPVYGRNADNNSSAQALYNWFMDANGNTPSAVTPWSPNAGDYAFYIIQAPKKISGSPTTYSFPDCEIHLGFDGVARRSFSINMNCNRNVEFVNLYVYGGIEFLGNSEAYSVTGHYGTYNFMKTPDNKNTIVFTGSNIGSYYAKPSGGRNYPLYRGHGLYGKYVSAGDVVVNLKSSVTSGQEYSARTQFELPGDFTEFKGVLDVTDITGNKPGFDSYVLLMLGESVMGDGSSPRADALKIGRRVEVRMIEDVLPVEGRDVTLTMTTDTELNDWVRFAVAAGERRTFATPIHGGHGRIEKVDAGALTVNSSFEVKRIDVKEGTLVIGDDASFAEGTVVTVKPGAHLICARGPAVPNVELVVEEGGKFAFQEFTVPFDGETATVTTLDCTGYSAADYAAMTKPIDIALSEIVPMPQNDTNRFPVARFAAGVGAQAGDFADAGERHFGYLPTTWFEVETQGDVSTVYLVAKPMIVRVGPTSVICRPFDTVYGTASGSSTPSGEFVWSDHLAAHAGADYVHASGAQMGSWTGSDNNTRVFPGDSLYLASQVILMKSRRISFPKLVIGPGGGIHSINGSPMIHAFAGDIELQSDLSLSGSREDNSGGVHTYALEANMSGSAKLTLSAVTNGFVGSVTGMNDAFKGMVEITNNKKPLGVGAGTTIELGNATGLGGELDEFRYNAITLRYGSMLRPLESMTLDVMTRGIHFATAGAGSGFDVPDGVDLEVRQTIRLGDGSDAVTLYKTGAGSLNLNGEMAFGFGGTNRVDGVNNVLEVREGFLKPADSRESGVGGMRVRFGAGAGIVVGGGGADGVFAESVEGEDPIVVQLDAAEIDAHGASFATPVCTVRGDGDIEFDVRRPQSLRGYTGKMRKTALDGDDAGLTRWSVNWEFGGTMLFIR